MRYTNGIFTGNYKECSEYLNASLPKAALENWPDGPWTVVADSVELSLAQRKELKRRELRRARDIENSVALSNISVASVEDRENLSWAIDNLGDEDVISWVMDDNTVEDLYKSDLQAVVDAYTLRKKASFEKYTGLLLQLETTEDPEAISW